MPGLKVVALISGGKDSLFSILHCHAQGHEVVALANLLPPQVELQKRVDDMESYMYQTIGHAVIPLYEQALDLPLYRQEIVGSAVNQRKDYAPETSKSKLDETESLVPLLRKVMVAHPEINAVSTGAILSDYQRTRVESVSLRLGLTPLSYLWQWPSLPPHDQTSLLQDMSAVGQDARIIKVASGGLDESFLWQNVADQRVISRLSRATARFGTAGDGAVLGEGGEFETLAVDGPAPLWKGRINVDQADTAIVAGEAGSASFSIVKATVEMKTEPTPINARVREPSLLDAKFESMLEDANSKHVQQDFSQSLSVARDTNAVIIPGSQSAPEKVMDTPQGALVVSQLTGSGANAAEQTRFIMESLILELGKSGHNLSNVVYTTIVLRDMNEFAAVNNIYGRYFTEPNPPARLTIACADVLPEEAHLSMGFTSFDAPAEGLHVQSRSYWAPANIGPYSQAIKLPDSNHSSLRDVPVFVAGQIPLVPASMEVVKSLDGTSDADFLLETVLALQHLVRIGVTMKVQQWTFAVVFVATSPLEKEPAKQKVAVIERAWEYLHTCEQNTDSETSDSEEETVDVWDLQNRPGFAKWKTQNYAEALPPRPSTDKQSLPPLRIIAVDALPRGSGIEWVGFGQANEASGTPKAIHLEPLLALFHERTIVVEK